VANIGAKNVYKIFAGGNHSWVVIDEVIPIKDKYRPPSPVPNNSHLTTNENRASRSKSPGGFRSSIRKSMISQKSAYGA